MIAAACRLAPGDALVEIGPGRGFLTEHLLLRPGRHLAVELDEHLAEGLRSRFSAKPWSVEHADFLDWTPGPEFVGRPLKFVGNLPYNASGPILRRILSWPNWSLAVVMLQKEVAQRVLAEPGSRAFGLLSLSVRLAAAAEPICEVSPACFRPPPKVDSMVLRLRPLPLEERPLPKDVAEEVFFKAARAAFSQRRKVMLNPLAAGLGLDKEKVRRALKEAGVPPGLRAEELDVAGYARLARELRKAGM